MKLSPNNIYHVFNRGNNRQKIFYQRKNYVRFLDKVKLLLFPVCDILAYCLMPNHFHFLIYASEKTVMPFTRYSRNNPQQLKMSVFAHGIKQLLSGYTKVINHQENRTGSLFSQNTKALQVSNENIFQDYAAWCFIYIHQNPLRGNLVKNLRDWEFSSYLDYSGIRKESICNKSLASELLYFDQNKFPFMEEKIVPDEILTSFKNNEIE